MPIKYYKLFDLLARRCERKTDLLKLANISSPTLAKLSKGEIVTTEIIEKICKSLNVQPGDIMEHIES
jgi:DNA-binding Xre family transcriptional regulator